jgi:hypothetical protein
MNAKTYHIINPAIVKCLDISTGHMTENDDKLLKAATDDQRQVPSDAIVYEYKEGYFVYVSSNPDQDVELTKEGFSAAFLNIIKKARSFKIKYVQFDADGITYADLPIFDW